MNIVMLFRIIYDPENVSRLFFNYSPKKNILDA